MSKTTKRKHVTKEALTEYYIPEDEEEIVKILAGRGNNLHEVEASDGRKFLVSMPSKFRKNLWVKRGDFVVVNPIKEGNKVLAEIIYVLYNKQIKYLQEQGHWPKTFHHERSNVGNNAKSASSQPESDDSSDEDDDLLFKNPNRKEFIHAEDPDTDTGDETENEEKDEDIMEHDVNLVGKNLSAADDSCSSETYSLNSVTQDLKRVTFSN